MYLPHPSARPEAGGSHQSHLEPFWDGPVDATWVVAATGVLKDVGLSIVMGGYPNSWMVFVRENPNLKWMITRGSPISGNHHMGIPDQCRFFSWENLPWSWFSSAMVTISNTSIARSPCCNSHSRKWAMFHSSVSLTDGYILSYPRGELPHEQRPRAIPWHSISILLASELEFPVRMDSDNSPVVWSNIWFHQHAFGYAPCRHCSHQVTDNMMDICHEMPWWL